MAYTDQQTTPVDVQTSRLSNKFDSVTAIQGWGSDESKLFSEIKEGLLNNGPEFAHSLAKDMGYTELVHDDRGGGRYFEVKMGSNNPINKLDSMSYDDKKNAYLPTVAQIAFMVPILGLRDDKDVSIVLDNMLKASNLKRLHVNWKNRASEWMDKYSQNSDYKDRIKFVREKYNI